MIIPQPESDLSLNVIVVGADIIKTLKDNKSDSMIVEELMKRFIVKDKRRTKKLFFDTLTFLYSLGIINEEHYRVRLFHGYTQKTLF
jgi:hypothetical protein